jgi:hypothetical protein
LWASLLRFGSFDSYNDTYTCLVHADWLRSHPVSEAPESPDLYPALTQAALYQQFDLRMGASFVLAWLHGLSGAVRGLPVCPDAVALACGSGLLALAGVLRRATAQRAAVCMAAGLIPAVAQDGVSFAAAFGFYPQTLGLTFAVSSFGLIAEGSISGAALSIGAAALISLPDLPRLVRGILVQAAAQVGTVNPVDLHDAVFHVTGFAGGPWEGWTRLIDPGWASSILAAAILVAALAGIRFARSRVHLAPFALNALLLGAAFLWFRFFADRSWRQTKAAGWAAWPVMALVIAGLLALARLPPGDPAMLEGFPAPRDKRRELLTYFVMASRPLLADRTGDDSIGRVLQNPDTRRPGVPWRLVPDLTPRPAD